MDDELREGTEAHYRDALYYDHAYARRRSDVFFYAELASGSGGPVLELGVGTGRVAREIARRGIDVVGVDSMPEMLKQAKLRFEKLPRAARDRIELRRGDMRRIRLARTFPMVISPFNVFMHLYERRDVERALATVLHHLKPQGRFVFDVLLPQPDALARDPQRIYRVGTVKRPGQGRRFNYRERFAYDAASQVQTVSMIFQDPDDPGAIEVTPLAHRQFFPAELEALLHYNGFTIEDRFGDFECGPLTGESDSQVIVAKRRRGYSRKSTSQ